VLGAGGRTQLIVTEQGAYFDGIDKPEERERGTRNLLDSLEKALQEDALPH
jgi:hypothetical protein